MRVFLLLLTWCSPLFKLKNNLRHFIEQLVYVFAATYVHHCSKSKITSGITSSSWYTSMFLLVITRCSPLFKLKKEPQAFHRVVGMFVVANQKEFPQAFHRALGIRMFLLLITSCSPLSVGMFVVATRKEFTQAFHRAVGIRMFLLFRIRKNLPRHFIEQLLGWSFVQALVLSVLVKLEV
ncbi:hypothetical protein L1887_38764 [Cichorium endivia]|nr:hypothetical protein L1887_38764 [Cichorium endivia]